jgi:hypothetical protein
MSPAPGPRPGKPVLGTATAKGPDDPQVASPRDTKAPRSGGGLALPHERDEAPQARSGSPDSAVAQAKRDIDAGMVDTDMWATPGLDAELRERLVPGPGGKAPAPHRR